MQKFCFRHDFPILILLQHHFVPTLLVLAQSYANIRLHQMPYSNCKSLFFSYCAALDKDLLKDNGFFLQLSPNRLHFKGMASQKQISVSSGKRKSPRRRRETLHTDFLCSFFKCKPGTMLKNILLVIILSTVTTLYINVYAYRDFQCTHSFTQSHPYINKLGGTELIFSSDNTKYNFSHNDNRQLCE